MVPAMTMITTSRRLFAATLFGLAAPLLATGLARAGDGDANPVVVELFTSQGCYSCPPAEAYLKDLAERPDVIALEFHVDYWDYIGWKDPYASPEFTARQHDYVRALGKRYAYTPQMVIGGRIDEVGSRRAAVAARIDAVAMEQKVEHGGERPTLTIGHDGGKLRISIDGKAPAGRTYDIVMVGFDKGHETDVTRGENSGKRLVNTHTVRALKTLGTWTGGGTSAELDIDQVDGDGGCAILLQEANAGPILAATMLRF